jgi:hypothetical protein
VLRTNYEGKVIDMMAEFIHHEYLPYPACLHDDALDSLARLMDDDMQYIWPRPIVRETTEEARRPRGTWMAG